jgi:hypothetical protein
MDQEELMSNNDEVVALAALAAVGGLLYAVSSRAEFEEPRLGSVFGDEYGFLTKKSRARSKAIKRCAPIGGKGASDYSYRRDPKMWCMLAKNGIGQATDAGELLRILRHSKKLGARVFRNTGMGPLVAIVDEMRQVPLKEQKRRFNKRCVPCGYKPMRYGTWISTSKHSYSKLVPKKFRLKKWARKSKRRRLKKFKDLG